ncbi:hypothetical protein C0214_27570 (plasmid) [Methylobacterium sp. DM1]|nr:hypothetical protein C0214_27570 [Methylobacterium sp. DM1]
MRSLLLIPVLLILSSTSGEATSPPSIVVGLPALEQTWHACVRGAYDRQPATQSKQAAQLGALDECRDHEDAYVAALTAVQVAEDEAKWRAAHPGASSVVSWFAAITAYFTASPSRR